MGVQPTLKGIVIPADNAEPIREVEFNNTLQGMRMQIGGGYIEYVRAIDSLFSPNVAIVDEEGLIKQLPMNHRAMLLLNRHLAGDVLLIGPTVNDGDDSDYTGQPSVGDLNHVLGVFYNEGGE